MAIAYVNGANNFATASLTTIAIAATSHTTGNLIVAMVFSNYASSSAVSSIADTAGNTYTFIRKRTIVGGDIEIWYAKNITGNASNVVTATFTGAVSNRGIMVHQYSGCDTTAPLDQQTDGQATALAQTVTDIATTTADEVLVAGFVEATTHSTYTAGSGFTKQLAGTSADAYVTYDKIVSATGTYPGGTINTVSSSADNTYIGITATFKAAGGGTILPMMMQHHGG
mgnify:CR=1 FL=1